MNIYSECEFEDELCFNFFLEGCPSAKGSQKSEKLFLKCLMFNFT